MVEQLVPAWLIVVPIVGYLLSWAVVPRLTERRLRKGLREGRYDDLLGGLVDYALQRASQTLKGKIAGFASGDARLERGLEGAMTLDLIRLENPLLADAINSLPEVRKYIVKHPEVAQLGIAYLQQKFPQLQGLMEGLQKLPVAAVAGATSGNGHGPVNTSSPTRW